MMGYDFYAYLQKPSLPAPADLYNSDGREEIEIAYFERGAHSTCAAELCKALQVEEFDAEVSGSARGRWFTPEEIVKALVYLTQRMSNVLEFDSELKFLATVLDRMLGNPEDRRPFVFIYFY